MHAGSRNETFQSQRDIGNFVAGVSRRDERKDKM